MKVAITGGSGVVGGAIVRHLVDGGASVTGLARSPDAEAAVESLGAVPARGHVLDPDALIHAFGGTEVVYHVAGVNEMCSSDPDHMYRINVDGTRAVVRACAAAGVRRLVHTSSAVTIGEPRGVVATESTPHRGSYLSDYERSKHHAEQVAFAEAGPLEVVAVNPSSVQGPGRAGGTGAIVLDVLRGRLPALIESDVSIVDIDDCARGHLLAAEWGAPGRRYLLSGFTTTVSGAVARAAAVLGRPIDAHMVPIWAARAAVRLADSAARLVGRRAPFCPEMIRVVAHGHRYDGSRATRELGLDYTSPDATIRRMVEWFRHEGLVE